MDARNNHQASKIAGVAILGVLMASKRLNEITNTTIHKLQTKASFKLNIKFSENKQENKVCKRII